ncbi:hypothetical protein FKM82_000548 [Ascaphus truei]
MVISSFFNISVHFLYIDCWKHCSYIMINCKFGILYAGLTLFTVFMPCDFINSNILRLGMRVPCSLSIFLCSYVYMDEDCQHIFPHTCVLDV